LSKIKQKITYLQFAKKTQKEGKHFKQANFFCQNKIYSLLKIKQCKTKKFFEDERERDEKRSPFAHYQIENNSNFFCQK
jgi:hypothetical protein